MSTVRTLGVPTATPADKAAKAGWALSFYGLLAATAYLQIRYYLLPVHDFNWLNWLDGDTIWQVERFLLDLKFPGVEMLDSGAIDYGSELFWLVPLFKAIDFFIPLTDPLAAYVLLTLVHLAAGIGALMLIRRLFGSFKAGGAWASAGALVVVASPLFSVYVSFVKPDPNVVLFFVCASIIGLFQYERTGRTRWLWLAVGAAGIGGAVKWWGGFMAFPLFYVAYRRRMEVNMRWAVCRWGRIGLLVILAASLAIFFLNPLFVKLAVYLKDQVLAGGGIGDPLAIRDKLLTGPWASVPKLNVVSLGVAAACLAVGMAADAVWTRTSKAILRGAGGIGRIVWMLCGAFLLIGASILVFDLPFLASDQMFGAVIYFSKYFLLTPQNLSSGVGQARIIGNSWAWSLDAWKSGFLSPALIAAGLFAVWVHVKRVKQTEARHLLNLIGLFLLPVLIFLFFLVQKKNWATQAMLLPILLAYILAALMFRLRQLSGPKRTWAIALLSALLVFQVGWQNRGRFIPDVWAYYQSRTDLPATVADLNEQLTDLAPYATVVGLCDRAFPLDGSRPFRQVDCRHGVNPLSQVKPGDVLVLNIEQANMYASFLDPSWVEVVGEIKGDRYLRTGRIEQDFRFRVYRVREAKP